ncbi:hypothetical protein SLEP1_g43433 [Rubroshorea leprosula]|uniref:RRM domain-containing protein n=1 Tax=Rubroshorea leprosula TaxID=152421 RepID=A0AAV5LCY3_9ROSI|nr:hypothetical protein SLEP1_g43433 [Rubroshorea leprosula]
MATADQDDMQDTNSEAATEDWGYEQLWKTFMKYGRVYAIYSPIRRNKEGNRFGFVRFLDVKNEKKLERQLDQIWVENRKLRVKSPRFKKNSKELALMKRTKSAIARRTCSNADVVAGRNSGLQQNTISKVGTDTRRERQFASSVSCYREVGMEKKKKKLKHGLDWISTHEDWIWLEGCYVGIARAVELVLILQERFYMEGLFSVRLRAMGGKMVLIDCDDKEELKDLIELASDWLSQWFDEIRPWTPTLVATERFVWVKCFGVSLHAWGPDLFNTIATLWGKFISLDESEENL